MVIRLFREEDMECLVKITEEAFDGVAIAQNIEEVFGQVADVSWQKKKGDDVRSDATCFPKGIFVAEKEGEVVGYITTRLECEYSTGRIINLAVASDHRRQGIGRQLILKALDFFRQEGITLARIETLDQNQVGKDFYPQFGFQEVACQIHYAAKL